MTNYFNSNYRIVWLDLIKLVSIFFVVWGHVIQYLQTYEPKNNGLWLFIYSFHMPLFMLLAGFFSYKVVNESFVNLIKSKIPQLLLPCIVWGIIVYVLKSLLNYHSTDLCLNPIIGVLWEIEGVLWFLKSLFICMLLYFFFKRNKYFLIFSILFSQLLLYKVPLMYPCFLIGLYCKRKDFFNRINVKITILIVIVYFISFYFFEARCMDTNLRATAMSLIEGEISPFLMEVMLRMYRLFVGVAGSLAIISFFKILYLWLAFRVKLDVFAKYGTQTQAVYVIHGPILVFAISSFLNFDFMSISIFNYLLSPVISLLLLLFCYFIINLLSPSVKMILFGSKN